MRWLIAATCLGVVTSPRTSAAQRESPAPRFFFAVGPTWTPNLSGFRLRAEYHLTRPDRAVSLRAESGRPLDSDARLLQSHAALW